MATGAKMAQGTTSEGAWPGGWLIAVVAAVVAAILARWLGDATMPAAAFVGAGVFLVFGVLLGMFWTEPVANHGHDGHGHAKATANPAEHG